MQDLLCKLRKFIGPWKTLFSGQCKSTEQLANEKKIAGNIDKFCKANGLSDRQSVLLSLVARRLDMLVADDYQKVADMIGANELESEQINDLLVKINNSRPSSTNFEYFPCILIVDEVRLHNHIEDRVI